MAKDKVKKFEVPQKSWEPDKVPPIIVPDDAIYYVVNNYLQNKDRGDGVSVLVGIPSETVEDVIKLLIAWAHQSGKIKDGAVYIGELEE
jgi:hypothetical protein